MTPPQRVLVVRQDAAGDMLLAGPCVRAVAAGAGSVTVLAGPRGRAAADLLPGVDAVLERAAPWIEPVPGPVDRREVDDAVAELTVGRFDVALVLTSFHQSPLPAALLLRAAGVPWIGAACEDYPGSLLDLRHPPEHHLPEPERMLSLADAAGFPRPTGDDGRLTVRRPLPETGVRTGPPGYVVLHPGASVPARRPSERRSAEHVRALADAGYRVVVTGGPDERAAATRIAGEHATVVAGDLDLPELAAVLDGARVVVAPNTGPAHLAAAVGTPVVSLFAPVVPAHRWQPYGVPSVLLGDQHAPCRDTRATTCPVPGHPCLDGVAGADVVAAVRGLTHDDPDPYRGRHGRPSIGGFR
ncbi:ADP-heptose:LPS heptosyltransferase [Pseudonocardia ammonioxydans]|uniref:ADP-heptose:LPS heptosyltransferase n=1 Tax=Pseudonocardia ammonioxydans TaxID=260086 RepID=A0A1I4XQF1_PSUAM|nr:glycosyltransferase family 9 protein [Pseudonocardia ammonioxydans]SFN28078.1 ADP-heptose:LPS heptosyltransferase [Pseudonocardia ammonioxydans]